MSQTEAKQIKGYILRIREDFLLNTAFVEVLTHNNFIEVKLPTKVENYKYKPFLNFGNLILFDLVKTRKHWIVTHLDYLHKLHFQDWAYIKFETLSELNKILLKNLHIDQGCKVLDTLKLYLERLDDLTLKEDPKNFLIEFESKILSDLGFN